MARDIRIAHRAYLRLKLLIMSSATIAHQIFGDSAGSERLFGGDWRRLFVVIKLENPHLVGLTPYSAFAL